MIYEILIDSRYKSYRRTNHKPFIKKELDQSTLDEDELFLLHKPL